MIDLSPGTRIERYEVDAELGRGGMAVVVAARHIELGTRHALKVLTLASPGVAERMIQEGRVQATIQHENVVAVRDVLRIGAIPCLVMELIDGVGLDVLLAGAPPTPIQVDHIADGLFAGVEAAHAAGLVHRDLKPSNVLVALTPRGVVVKVTDFGLAKVIEADGLGSHRTRSGQMMGTPAYMAPEQFRDAKRADRRADIFAIGAILYELVSGELAFDGDGLVDVYTQTSMGQYVPLDELEPGLPDRVVRAVHAALAPRPEDRPQTVADLRALWFDGIEPPTSDDAWSDKDRALLRNLIEIHREVAAERPAPAPAEPTVDPGGAAPTLPPPSLIALANTGSPDAPRPRRWVAAVAGAGLLVGLAGIAAVGMVAWIALSDSLAPGAVDAAPNPTMDDDAPIPLAVDGAPTPRPEPSAPPAVSPTAEAPSLRGPAPSNEEAPASAASTTGEPPDDSRPADPVSTAPAPADGALISAPGFTGYLTTRDGTRYPLGAPTPPGTYAVWVFFEPNTPTRVMELTVDDGTRRSLTCSTDLGICR